MQLTKDDLKKNVFVQIVVVVGIEANLPLVYFDWKVFI